jgi:hypothetical protein
MCFALLVYVGHAFCIFVLFLLCIFLLSLSFVYLEIHLDFTLKVLSNGAGGGWRVVSIDPI